MEQKVKITFVVPTTLQNEMRSQIIKDGYGLRGKSQWVGEAIQDLLSESAFADWVNVSDGMSGFEKAETIVLDKSLKNKLEAGILDVRKAFPILEGVQSCIVRTAIMQKLLRSL